MSVQTKDVDMVLVMGLSGAGKSYFINCLTGAIAGGENEAVVGTKLVSCTSKCQVIPTNIGNTDFVIVDCPGFDDTVRSDTNILHEITETLSALYVVGLRLKGVIYLQRITDNKMQGSSMKNLQLFIKMIGKEPLSNVIFTTTMWGKVKTVDMQEANARDAELRDEYWADYINQGATATRFNGTKESAEGILSVLLGKKDVVLQVQDELVNGGKTLRETEVGEFLEPTVEEEKAEFEAKVNDLDMKIKAERDGGRRLDYQRRQRKARAGKEQRQNDEKTLRSRPGQDARKKLGNKNVEIWKNALQALAAVVSIGAAVTGIVLSAVGG